MKLYWLDDFLALASTGNFSRAADDRHVTQPPFGRRVLALEESLGTELFDRSSQPVRLTKTGQWFHSIAQDLLAQVARVPGEARAVAEARSNSLRFAATHGIDVIGLTLKNRGLGLKKPSLQRLIPSVWSSFFYFAIFWTKAAFL